MFCLPPVVIKCTYSKTFELRTSRIRLPPSYDRFFIDGLFSLLCICKSSLWNTITSQTRHTMMKNGRNTIGHKFLSLEKRFFRVNYRKISRDGFIVTEFPAILSLVHHFESNLRHGWFPLIKGKSPPVTLAKATRRSFLTTAHSFRSSRVFKQ